MSSRTAATMEPAVRPSDLDMDEMEKKKDAVFISTYEKLNKKLNDLAAENEILKKQVASLLIHEPTLKRLTHSTTSESDFSMPGSPDESAKTEDSSASSDKSVDAEVQVELKEDLGKKPDWVMPKTKDLLHIHHADGSKTPLWSGDLPQIAGELMKTS